MEAEARLLTDYDRYAHRYDLAHTGTLDIPFYVELARECAGPVLELGCGTGRVLVPVAEAGAQAWGLDNSRAMLARARERLAQADPAVVQRIRLVEGDMARFDLEETFDRIYIPYRGFLVLLTAEEQIGCLAAVRRHLRPGGRLALSFFNPDLSLFGDPTIFHGTAPRRLPHADHVDPATGDRVLAWLSLAYDPASQVCREVRTFERLDASGRVVERHHYTTALRWIFRWEMVHLLARTGFAVEALYGGFQREPPRARGGELVWIARPS